MPVATRQPYVYRVDAVDRVIDGDTLLLAVSCGFHVTVSAHIRLLGYDCPERHRGSTFERGRATQAAVVAGLFLAPADGQLWVRTEKDPDSFGRWLGDVWRDTPDGPHRLGDVLAAQNLATPWPTRWRDIYDVQHTDAPRKAQ